MGREYVIDHCVTALNQEKTDKFYRVYVTECLRMMSKNTAVAAQALSNGKAEAAYMSMAYQDILEEAQKPKDTRTGEEIISDFLAEFGGKEETK